MSTPAPFSRFLPPMPPRSALRQAITALTRAPEPDLMPGLIAAARVSPAQRQQIAATATQLVTALRGKRRGSGVEGLVQEYSLSSDEGVALMCLAEALLRIPDSASRDALIRDKTAGGDWKSHLGSGRPLFVNAATWGLVVTGKLTATASESGLSRALTRLISRAGEPVIRRGVALAMRLMGEQFVTGQTIDEALRRARPLEARGYGYSYDMLGEAATTAQDAARYLAEYQQAIEAIGTASAGRGIYRGPGISIKLSALHPRYSRAQSERVRTELLPRVKALCLRAKHYDIGLNIDAEESDRLELSLDLLEALATDLELAGWDGLGFVVQAYGKRCPAVLDYVIDLARRAGRRLMVRLVKGAYWDSEIKRAQVDGLPGFPVYTRKIHTDVAYLACARKLLAARAHVFPQFATHNAQTLASIYHLAGAEFRIGDYEFQCLHGMGEPLYDEVVGPGRLDRPCRIYAPVGTHETLLGYLVRRLLENGANSSFVHRIGDASVPIPALTEDPAETLAAETAPGRPHPGIAAPSDIFGARRNSAGLDLASDAVLAPLQEQLLASAARSWEARPADLPADAEPIPVRNPACPEDIVGTVIEAGLPEAGQALSRASSGFEAWSQRPAAERAACLERAADSLQAAMPELMGLLIREAGKSAANAVAEVREAIDFLRYYAEGARNLTAEQRALGTVICISPWNFPLAIFAGQVAAALATGNAVLAKPANATPLIAAEAVRHLIAAGVPESALQLLPCPGAVAGQLLGDPRVSAVMFTGSTGVAQTIRRQLAGRLTPDGQPVPLIAETGGQNAMIVDSSALAEQVVADVIASAFDSAGQRCSALRVLCLQDEIAERTIDMLKGAMAELRLGRTDELANDIGPLITRAAKDGIEAHIRQMRDRGHTVFQAPRGPENAEGWFLPPTLITISALSDLGEEVFGPVLHVLRYKRADLPALIEQINATGYGLTFGLHSRIDETINSVTERITAGNLYVNRNTIGAVVGSQPFGGTGLSGTGPKAGGPLYLGRLTAGTPALPLKAGQTDPAWTALETWAAARGQRLTSYPALPDASLALPGPVGESNLYRLRPKGAVLLLASSEHGLLEQLSVTLATGNTAIILAAGLPESLRSLPGAVQQRIRLAANWQDLPEIAAALIEGPPDRVLALSAKLAARPGRLIQIQTARGGNVPYRADLLVDEQVLSINTTAAGGNASLMTIS